MEWNERLQVIIDYVENHLQRLEDPLDYQEISRMAGCSYGFFQKVFSYMNDMSFSEYVRSRKLTLAGYDLKSTNMKVVDVSFKYGYDSPTSFTKAFQQFHGITPKEARHENAKLQIVPKMQLTSPQKFSWKIETKPSFHLVGISKRFSSSQEDMYLKVPEFWSECQNNGNFYNLCLIDEGDPQGLFGYFQYQEESVEYSIMVIHHDEARENVKHYTVPELTWAIFDCYGPVPKSIHDGWKYLYEEWLIEYPFQHAPYPDLEWYSNGNTYSKDYLTQIWIPIIEDK